MNGKHKPSLSPGQGLALADVYFSAHMAPQASFPGKVYLAPTPLGLMSPQDIRRPYGDLWGEPQGKE